MAIQQQRSDALGLCAHLSISLMTNTKECYRNVLAQLQSIAALLLEGQYVDWTNFDINKFTPRLNSVKAVL
ncbi:MAG: hypothetical protein ACKPKO_59885, partial [Candidatus Fonsibacter sp.]